MNNTKNYTEPTTVVKNVSIEYNHQSETKPYVCPVCSGKGIVPNGFYLYPFEEWASSSIAPEKCRSCNGTGIVWK